MSDGSKGLVLNRRRFLAMAGGLVAAGVLPRNTLALADHYAFKQGAYDITILGDGSLVLPLSVISPRS